MIILHNILSHIIIYYITSAAEDVQNNTNISHEHQFLKPSACDTEFCFWFQCVTILGWYNLKTYNTLFSITSYTIFTQLIQKKTLTFVFHCAARLISLSAPSCLDVLSLRVSALVPGIECILWTRLTVMNSITTIQLFSMLLWEKNKSFEKN